MSDFNISSDKNATLISPSLNSFLLPSSNISSENIDQIISRLEKAIEKVDILSSIVEKNSLMKSVEKESSSPLTNFWKNSLNLLQIYLIELLSWDFPFMPNGLILL